jgi:hypothetical protein
MGVASTQDAGRNTHPDTAAIRAGSDPGNKKSPKAQSSRRAHSESSHLHNHLHSHLDNHPSPSNPSLPPFSADDLSTYPPKIAQALETSREISMSTPCMSTNGPQYQLVQQDWLVEPNILQKEQVMGVFASRHTANREAANVFVHRFWNEVMMAPKQYYKVLGDEAGILTLRIYTGPQGKRKWTCVFVRNKGMKQMGVEGPSPP